MRPHPDNAKSNAGSALLASLSKEVDTSSRPRHTAATFAQGSRAANLQLQYVKNGVECFEMI